MSLKHVFAYIDQQPHKRWDFSERPDGLSVVVLQGKVQRFVHELSYWEDVDELYLRALAENMVKEGQILLALLDRKDEEIEEEEEEKE